VKNDVRVLFGEEVNDRTQASDFGNRSKKVGNTGIQRVKIRF